MNPRQNNTRRRPPQNRRPGSPRPNQPRQNRPGYPPNGYADQRRYIPPEERARREAIARRRRAEAERRRLMEERRRAEEERRRRQQQAYEERMRRQRRAQRRREFAEWLKILGGRLLVFGAVLVIMVLLCAGAFLLSLNAAPDKPDDSGKVRYYYGGSEVRAIDTSDAVVDGNVYFCFNDLADYLEMSETGTADAMKFVLPYHNILPQNAQGKGNEDSVVFLTDATTIILNGQTVVMDVPNILRGTEVWVSSDFVANFMENISLTYDAKKREMRISRIKDEEHSTKELTLYLYPDFTLKSTASIPPIPEDPLIGDIDFSSLPDSGAAMLTFSVDLSSYEAYMNPQGDLRDAFLAVASNNSPLDSGYAPTNLHEVANISVITSTQYLSEYAAKALEAMFKEMKANEFYSMAVYAGYRSYDEQSALFEAQVNNLLAFNQSLTRNQAEQNAAFSVARPGTDDHQTGLSVDMDTLGCVSTDFQFQPEFKWLTDNAWKFGFILRYPRDKTTTTGHAFEPWHYRYVGRYHAQKIHASGLCLEEYLAQIK